MAGSEIWSLVEWERGGVRRGFLVKSLRSGRFTVIPSEAQANAEVRHEDDADYAALAEAAGTVRLNAEPYTPPEGTEIEGLPADPLQVWTVLLPGRSQLFFGTDDHGALATNVAGSPNWLAALTQPPGPGVG